MSHSYNIDQTNQKDQTKDQTPTVHILSRPPICTKAGGQDVGVLLLLLLLLLLMALSLAPTATAAPASPPVVVASSRVHASWDWLRRAIDRLRTTSTSPAAEENPAPPLDTDGDGLPDTIDSDDDNDHLSDADELRAGTDPLNPDTDGDGLEDNKEPWWGLDPLNPDSDGDGRSDGEELRGVVRSNPREFDTDHDGLSDGDEVARGTNPKTADTDGDGLADGDEVALGCDPLQADTDGDGLADRQEIRLATDPHNPDTDSDGLHDGEELRIGTNPRAADSDNDGLTDLEDIRAGANPNRWDTDGDGLMDGTEVQLGTNPAKADTDNDGYSDYDELHDRRLTHPNATYHPAGVHGADPLTFDIFVELDYLAPKTSYWLFTWHGHRPKTADMQELVSRFADRHVNLFIVVDDAIPHDGIDVIERAQVTDLRAIYRDNPVYYHALFADRGKGDMAHFGGHAFRRDNAFVVFDGKATRPGATTMHELGHCLLDSARINPAAAHLLSDASEWTDGIHCPNNCVMNYWRNLSAAERRAQRARYDYCDPCWNAIRGFYAGYTRRP